MRSGSLYGVGSGTACAAAASFRCALHNRSSTCAVRRRDLSVGGRPTRQLSLRPVAIGAVVEVTKRLKPSMERATAVAPRACGLQRAVNAEQAPKRVMWRPTRPLKRGRPLSLGKRAKQAPSGSTGVLAAARMRREIDATREAPLGGWSVTSQPDAREGQAGPGGVAEGLVVPMRPGNSGGGKGPWFKTTQDVAKDRRLDDGPGTSGKRSEAADGVTGESEGYAELSVLPSVRQVIPQRRPEIRLRSVQGQQGCTRR